MTRAPQCPTRCGTGSCVRRVRLTSWLGPAPAAAGEDPGGGDIVGARRPGGDDTLQECAPHVLLVHELHWQRRHEHRHREPASPPRQKAAQRLKRSGKQVLRANGVRAEHDRRAQQVERKSVVPDSLGQQLVLNLGLLLRIEQPPCGPDGPFLGHADRVVGVEAVSGH